MLLPILLLLSLESIFSFQNYALKSHIFFNNKLTVRATTSSALITSNQDSTSSTIKFYQTISNLGKPPLVFIPGLDGTGDYSTESLHNLTKEYDVW